MNQPFKADFIIVGAMKSGTSSLVFHLGRHREVCIPGSEVHFFENETNYGKGLDWYGSKILKHKTDRTVIIGEKTTAYSYDPKVAEQIQQAFPNVKLVWIFREPVARAYSNYIHAFRAGSDSCSFEEAVQTEPERIKRSIYFGYMERGRYAGQVKRFEKYFSKDQMHFILFEEFIKQTREELLKLFNFLGVGDDEFIFLDEPRGRGVMPRFPKTVYKARQMMGPGLLWKAIKFLNTALKKPGYPKLDPKLKAELKQRFKEDNAELAALTGLDLSPWE